jgi:uncharacterized protein (DUF58 family)
VSGSATADVTGRPSVGPERAGSPAAAAAPRRGTRRWWAGMLPVPTLRLAAGLAVVGAVVLVAPVALPVWPVLVVAASLLVVDGALAPAPWRIGVHRTLPAVLPLEGEGTLRWELSNPGARRLAVAVADELPPSLGAGTRRVGLRLPPRGRAQTLTTLHPRRRGTFRPTELTVRVTGPLGLATRQAARDVPGRIEVHPSFRSRDAAELRIRRARILEEGRRSVRGRGGGTEFEALRDYVEGDEFRHVDWAATARTGRPVVRTYRAERNQTVLVLLDTGRVVAGLVGGVPRLDHGMDATLALATVATRSGDRAGLLAFGAEVRALVPPRRDTDQLRRLSSAMHALEPELNESGYRDAFRLTLARFRRRALLVIITELAAEAVQETLLPALPLVAREHAVIVASVRDPELTRLAEGEIDGPGAAYTAAAAASLLAERRRVAALLRAAGAHVVDAAPDELAAALADTYLDVKARGAL